MIVQAQKQTSLLKKIKKREYIEYIYVILKGLQGKIQ